MSCSKLLTPMTTSLVITNSIEAFLWDSPYYVVTGISLMDLTCDIRNLTLGSGAAGRAFDDPMAQGALRGSAPRDTGLPPDKDSPRATSGATVIAFLTTKLRHVRARARRR